MKRKLLVLSLLILTIIVTAACGNSNNDSSKFEGTWIGFYENNGDPTAVEITIQQAGKQVVVSRKAGMYVKLTDQYSSGLVNVSNKPNSTVYVDYQFAKMTLPVLTGTVSDDTLTVKYKDDTGSYIYNKNNDTLLYEGTTFKKKSNDASLESYIPEMQKIIKETYLKNHQKEQSIAKFDFFFDDSMVKSEQ